MSAAEVTPRRYTRRAFVGALPLGALLLLRGARSASAQETAPIQGGAAVTNEPEVAGASMEGDGYIPVNRPAKADARPSMTAEDRDALEHRLSCPCPCTLDVFTCRTSMPCGFSPRLHADVVALVEGGYSGEEILDAFKQSYGEKILMAPEAKGFNLVGYLMPFIAIGGGGVLLAQWLRRRRSAVATTAGASVPVAGATREEMARLDAAVRDEDDTR